ncbi:2,4-diaminobutyric acid acetyltransferase [Photobacterium aquae]|uniref:L-2,4-diaminobutyric acid acetyltransferase n=1 Tax=Photobacterium aquae TaxID=1195763 RepID=A0A0J1GYB0_9GAMM|nr:diaminobutyrate acetyltransferase [Photobacterium aquae]KLV04656.1 2,4-diaminobutyric acid acetyltransferase [Photobacterium aquae]
MRDTLLTSASWAIYPEILGKDNENWAFRSPTISDGDQIHALIASCPPLDTNSAYCNFLQSSHFNETCILATCDDTIAGFISGYLKPGCDGELFIWQVAVSPAYRGKGLAYSMLQALLRRPGLDHVTTIETTITKNNHGSWRLFKKLARENGSKGAVTTFLDEKQHFKGKHDTEFLYRIPLNTEQ